MSPHDRLGALVGVWKTDGWTREGARIDAVDSYAWLPGRLALLHRVDARVGDHTVEGAEIIGYDSARGSYAVRYVGSDGEGSYEASLGEEDGALVWRMRGEKERFAGTFGDDGTITGSWERLDGDSGWRPWMDVTLRRQAA